MSGFTPPPYPYDRLAPLKAAAEASPGGLVDLSIGTPCDDPPANVIAALADPVAARTYPPSIGTPAYREAASEWLGRRLGVEVERASLAACVGTKEMVAGLPHWLRLRNPGLDTVLYPAVSYPTYAMGAKLANPDVPVACVTGEASIQMNIQELSTCKQFRLPIKIVNLNNRYLGMVRQWQELFHGGRYSESYMDSLTDFAKLAEAYGHVGIRVDTPADVEGALREAFKQKNELVFLDFQVDQTENVYPMVQGGKGLTEMILSAEDL